MGAAWQVAAGRGRRGRCRVGTGAVFGSSMSAPLPLSPRSEVAITVTMQSLAQVTSASSSPVVDGEDVVAVRMALSSLICREFHTSAGTRPEA